LACYSESTQAISFYNDFPASLQNQSVIYPPRPVTSASAFSPDERYLIWADIDHQINLYDRQQNKIVKRFPAHSNLIRSILVSNDQRHLYSASFDGSVQSWRFPDGHHEKILFEGQNEMYSMVFSTVDNLLFTSDIIGNIHVFSTISFSHLYTMRANSSPILHLSNPVQGLIVASSAEKKIFLWHYHSGILANQTLPSNNAGKIVNLQLSADKELLFVAYSSGEIIILDPLSGTLYEVYDHENYPLQTMKIMDNGLWIFSQNGKINSVNSSIWQQLLRPIKLTDNHRLTQIAEMQSNQRLTTEQNNWLDYTKALTFWQKRYDIDVDVLHTPILLDDISIIQ